MTWGHELQNKEDTRYGRLVSDHFGATEHNDAWPGGSNFRIVRRLNQHLLTDRPDFVFIMWTGLSRWESIGAGHRGSPYQQLSPQVVFKQNYNVWGKQFHSDKLRATAYEHFYDAVFTGKDQIIIWLGQVIAVQNLCKYAGIPYAMSLAFYENQTGLHNRERFHEDVRREIEFYDSHIDWSKWVDNGKWAFRDHVRELGVEFGEKNHPLEKGHEIGSRHIIDHIERIHGKVLL